MYCLRTALSSIVLTKRGYIEIVCLKNTLFMKKLLSCIYVVGLSYFLARVTFGVDFFGLCLILLALGRQFFWEHELLRKLSVLRLLPKVQLDRVELTYSGNCAEVFKDMTGDSTGEPYGMFSTLASGFKKVFIYINIPKCNRIGWSKDDLNALVRVCGEYYAKRIPVFVVLSTFITPLVLFVFGLVVPQVYDLDILLVFLMIFLWWFQIEISSMFLILYSDRIAGEALGKEYYIRLLKRFSKHTSGAGGSILSAEKRIEILEME